MKTNDIEHPVEFLDVYTVLDQGATKHGANGWLETDVFRFNARSQSIFRHLMKSTGLWYTRNLEVQAAIGTILNSINKSTFYRELQYDNESQLPHWLHGAANNLMFYTLFKRGILQQTELNRNKHDI